MAELTERNDAKSACAAAYDLLIRNSEFVDFFPGKLQQPQTVTDNQQQEQVWDLMLV